MDTPLGIINSFIPAMRQGMIDEIRKSFDRHHRARSGKLRKSINASVHISRASDIKAIIKIFGIAGGSKLGAYYGWFLEYGTGIYTALPAQVPRGYLDVDFNPLRPRAGGGWEIVGRPDGPYPGKFISHGIKPSHWFREGVANGLAVFDALNIEIAAALDQYRQIASKLQSVSIKA